MDNQRIALDVMGGDNAPQATLRGVLRACSEASSVRLEPERLLLVGDGSRIEAGLAELGAPQAFEVRHASQVVEMHDAPAAALRNKRNSSIAVCVEAVGANEAGALVSMGNTGAVVATATRGLGTLQGVKRPGIAVTMDLGGHPVTVLDMGANIAPKPEHLLQYGLMGAVYARECLKCVAPRVGLLNIGEEESKGTDLLKEAHRLLRGAPIEFVGNIEGNVMFHGLADVIVVDGLTGNIVLKLLEGFAAFLLGLVLGQCKQHGVDWGGEVLANVQRRIDYAEYGGAMLLGVNGVVVVGHGRSDGTAVANAISLAARNLDACVNAEIVRGVAHAAEERERGAAQ
jgi:glycerol-3-phosphate acyltransferase PlsX